MNSSRYAAEIERLQGALRGKRARQLAKTLRLQLESLPVAALATDDSSRYVAANARAEELTGYSTAELAELTVMDLTPVPHTDDAERLWQEFVSSGEQSGQYEVRRKGGSSVHVQYWAYANVAPGIHVSLLLPETTIG